MENLEQNKMLLAVDGSDHAFEAVRYISKIQAFQQMKVVLFNVNDEINESYWDLEKTPGLKYKISEVRAWEIQQQNDLEDYMEKAKHILLHAGFGEEAVETNICRKEKGIARDIIGEAKVGYRCVVIGRKGLSKLNELVFGSVSTKLIERIDFAPVLIVGENPSTEKILFALDGSDGAMRALDSVGSLLVGSNLEAGLLHVIRTENEAYIKEAKKKIKEVFDKAIHKLIKSGFDSEKISIKIITGAHSRAGAIVEEAKKGDYGTIVVGRRGLSKVREFGMGRVTNKVLHLSKEMTVWLVS